ncbi:MAG: hypothetical protein Q4F18_15240 [Clostridia bacterium]|nr:hypothetical protein [Clostridia bacterium]
MSEELKNEHEHRHGEPLHMSEQDPGNPLYANHHNHRMSEARIGARREVSCFPTGELSADAMRFLYELGKQDRGYAVQEIDGHIYVNTDNLQRVEPVMPMELPVMKIFTLNGFIAYILDDPDSLIDKFGRLVVSVGDEAHVYLHSVAYGPENAKRSLLAFCTLQSRPFSFNTYLGQEDFIVRLQAQFERTEARDKVGQVVGNLAAEQGVHTSDDGISQRVIIKRGVARMGDVVLENPVPLKPYRTFPEIDQVESPFILRIRNKEGQKETEIALYEADGGMWRSEAVARIRAYLADNLKVLIEAGMLSIIA